MTYTCGPLVYVLGFDWNSSNPNISIPTRLVCVKRLVENRGMDKSTFKQIQVDCKYEGQHRSIQIVHFGNVTPCSSVLKFQSGIS